METTVENKEYFSTIIDAMTDLIRVVDEEGRILMINAAMQEVAGSCLGKQCFECLGESSPCPDCVREGVLQSGRIARAERTIRGRCYSLTAAPVKDGGGNTRAVVEVFRDISDMANLRNRLVTANAKMVQDLSMARTLQKSMMRRRLPDLPGSRFYRGFYPCEAVGGDAIDCLRMPDGRVLFYVADVSGHGVHAAMLTVFVQQEVSFLSREPGITLPVLAEKLTQSFLELNTDESAYITAFFVILDGEKETITYMNAGHSAVPYLYQKGEMTELFLPGTPICRWDDKPGGELSQASFTSGDRLILYSDGMIGVHQAEQPLQRLKTEFSREPFDGREVIAAAKRDRGRNLSDDLAIFICEHL